MVASPIVIAVPDWAAGARQVERVAAPSSADLVRDASRRSEPVIYTGLTPPEATEAMSFARLRADFGGVEVRVAPVEGGHVMVDAKRGLVTTARALGPLLDDLLAGRVDGYVAMPVADLPAALARRVPVPAPIAALSWSQPRFWVGGAGTLSALHRDFADNLHTVLAGRKRFWMVTRDGSADVYPARPWASVPNGSRVDPVSPDFERFPRFARVRPFVADVAPGETLVLPHGVWHHVCSLEPTVSTNAFYARGARNLVVRATDLVKRVRGLNR